MQVTLDEETLELSYWANHVIEQIHERMATQGVWPFGHPGPYKSYADVNTKRAMKGRWHSTGRAASTQALYAKVYNAAGGDTKKITFFYTHYMDFVTMGVGRDRKLAQATENAKPNKNPFVLFAKWGIPLELMSAKQRRGAQIKGTRSRKSRPGVMQEIRHQVTRLERMMTEHYGRLVEASIVKDSEFIDINTVNNSGSWIEIIESK